MAELARDGHRPLLLEHVAHFVLAERAQETRDPALGALLDDRATGLTPFLAHDTPPSSGLMVVEYAAKGDSFVAGKPRLWSGKRLANVGLIGNFDLTPDGKRLAVLMPAGPEAQESQRHIMLLLNFFDEVRRQNGGRVR